jgi:hypothetical protein
MGMGRAEPGGQHPGFMRQSAQRPSDMDFTQAFAILWDDLFGETYFMQMTVVNPGYSVAHLQHCIHAVRYQQNRNTLFAELADPVGAFMLKRFVADRKDLIDN